MMDFGCHRLEVLTDLFGDVRQIKSIVSSDIFKREVEDTATVILQFESGVCANLTVTHAALESQDTLDIFGTKGSIRVPVLNKSEIRITTTDGERIEQHPPHPNPSTFDCRFYGSDFKRPRAANHRRDRQIYRSIRRKNLFAF